jgi:hypothetical protein
VRDQELLAVLEIDRDRDLAGVEAREDLVTDHVGQVVELGDVEQLRAEVVRRGVLR